MFVQDFDDFESETIINKPIYCTGRPVEDILALKTLLGSTFPEEWRAKCFYFQSHITYGLVQEKISIFWLRVVPAGCWPRYKPTCWCICFAKTKQLLLQKPCKWLLLTFCGMPARMARFWCSKLSIQWTHFQASFTNHSIPKTHYTVDWVRVCIT